MSARNGKPCVRCGGHEWYANGNCRPCGRESNRRWRLANPGKVESSRRWQRDHKEKANESSRRWQRNNPDRVKEINRLWQAANRDRVRQKQRSYRQAHKEKGREGSRRWRQNNPEARRATRNRYRARKAGAGGSFTTAEWKALINHYGNKCLCCGRTDVKLTADHVVPISKGGTSNIDNIQPLCFSCNSSKYDKTIDYRPDAGLGRWIQRKLLP